MIHCRNKTGPEAPLGHRTSQSARNGHRNCSGRVVRPVSHAVALLLLVTLAGCQQFPSFEFPWMSGTDQNARRADPDGSSATRRALVGKVQYRLARLGYKPGPADGLAGPRTYSAVKRYQDDRRLRVDGKITSGLLANLEKFLQTQAGRRKQTGPDDAEGSRTPGRMEIAFPLSRAQLPDPEVRA